MGLRDSARLRDGDTLDGDVLPGDIEHAITVDRSAVDPVAHCGGGFELLGRNADHSDRRERDNRLWMVLNPIFIIGFVAMLIATNSYRARLRPPYAVSSVPLSKW